MWKKKADAGQSLVLVDIAIALRHALRKTRGSLHALSQPICSAALMITAI